MERLVKLRNVARRFGREIFCNRSIYTRMADSSTLLIGYISRTLTIEQKRSLGLWFQKEGPFWEDDARHNDDRLYECGGELVNGMAVAEATQFAIEGFDSGLVSIIPSNWERSPLVVMVDEADQVEIRNFWEPRDLETTLESSPPSMSSWSELKEISVPRFRHLTFLDDCFDHLRGIGFSNAAAISILRLLEDLDRLMRLRDASGARTAEGQQLYEDKFIGQDPKFTDSSDTEKRQFEKELTFRNPIPGERALFCTWHGKVKRDLIRIHFAWPEAIDAKMYVAYIGRKLTIK